MSGPFDVTWWQWGIAAAMTAIVTAIIVWVLSGGRLKRGRKNDDNIRVRKLLSDYLVAVEHPELPPGARIAVFPHGRTVLRPVREGRFDTVTFDPVTFSTMKALWDCQRHPDGTQKWPHETNMTQSGALGCPLEFDCDSIDLHFEEFADPADVRRFLNCSIVRLITGQNMVIQRTAGSMFSPIAPVVKPAPAGIGGVGAIKIDVAELAEEMTRKGGAWLHYSHPVSPRRFGSTDLFYIEIEVNRAKDAPRGPMKLKVVLDGTLWGCL